MQIPIQSPPLAATDLVAAVARARFPVSAIPDQAPLHEWLFAEASGSLALDALGGVNGTLSASVTREANGPSGLRAVHITGANDSFVSFGAGVGQFGKSDFTVALWVKTSEQLRYFDIVGNRTDGSHGNFFCVRMTGRHESLPAGMFSVEVDQDGGGTNYVWVQSSCAGLNDGAWHHVAASRRGPRLTLYVDGQPCGSAAAGAPADVNNGHELRLGRSLVGVCDVFAPNASFADLQVYDLGLDDQHVWQVYAGVGRSPAAAGTIAEVKPWRRHCLEAARRLFAALTR